MILDNELLFTAGLYMAESCVVPARKQPKSYTDQAFRAAARIEEKKQAEEPFRKTPEGSRPVLKRRSKTMV